MGRLYTSASKSTHAPDEARHSPSISTSKTRKFIHHYNTNVLPIGPRSERIHSTGAAVEASMRNGSGATVVVVGVVAWLRPAPGGGRQIYVHVCFSSVSFYLIKFTSYSLCSSLQRRMARSEGPFQTSSKFPNLRFELRFSSSRRKSSSTSHNFKVHLPSTLM